MTRPLALVTGGSSGIGRAMALLLARDGHDLALVGRDRAKLAAAAAECGALGASCVTMVEDLAQDGAGGRIMKELGARGVDVLVNNAGFGLHGPFWRTSAGSERAMLRTHLDSALDLTRAVLPGMVARKSGRIVTVSSLYAFVPGPGQAIYAATKAFLFSWSLSLNAELDGTGVTATAVLPGPTRSEFHARAGLKPKSSGLSAEKVAEAAWRGAKAGKAVVIPGAGPKAFVAFSRLLPTFALGPLMKAVNRVRGV